MPLEVENVLLLKVSEISRYLMYLCLRKWISMLMVSQGKSPSWGRGVCVCDACHIRRKFIIHSLTVQSWRSFWTFGAAHGSCCPPSLATQVHKNVVVLTLVALESNYWKVNWVRMFFALKFMGYAYFEDMKIDMKHVDHGLLHHHMKNFSHMSIMHAVYVYLWMCRSNWYLWII